MLSDYSPAKGLVIQLSLWTLAGIMFLWQIVGIWRSASSHTEKGGRVFWAAAAKFMVVIAILQTFVIYKNNAIPQINEAMKIALGDKEIGQASFRILNKGTELELIGGIAFGTSERLREFLDAAPEVKAIHLNSHGGRIAEAKRLRDLIRERNLSTVTTSKCLSACTIAFMGGYRRYLHPRSGKLGFHAGDSPGVDSREMHATNSELAAEFVSLGVDKAFARKAFNIDHSKMWYPTHEELQKANVVTSLSSGQFALSGFGRTPDHEKVMAWLNKTPVYVALQKIDKHQYDAISDVFTEGILKGLPEKEINGPIRNKFGNILKSRAPFASDEAILNLTRVMIEELKLLHRIDPRICHNFLFPSKGNFVNVSDYFPAELAKRDLAASEEVLISSLTPSSGKVPPKELEDQLGIIIEKLVERYGEKFAVYLSEFGAEKNARVTCPVAVALYGSILKQPKQLSADLLRMMYADEGN